MDIRFPGQWFQLETGLAYNWHRHYDATIGRYVQPDFVGSLITFRTDQNLFAYVNGETLTFSDSQGLIVSGPPSKGQEQGPGESTDEQDQSHGIPTNPLQLPPFGIPTRYTSMPSQKGGGIKYCDPNDSGTYVRVMPGNPDSPFPAQQTPYVKDLRNGQAVDVNGNPVNGKSPEAHIPQSKYWYK
jgi:RHS repeat-associated protein